MCDKPNNHNECSEHLLCEEQKNEKDKEEETMAAVKPKSKKDNAILILKKEAETFFENVRTSPLTSDERAELRARAAKKWRR